MKYYLDTANIDEIVKYNKTVGLSGVTTNPSILKKEGKIDFFKRMKEIQNIIGDKELHIQVVGEKTEDILEDAYRLCNELGNNIYVKVPVTENGLEAMRVLKEKDYNVTATAIYTQFQGTLAISVGVDYIAPYYNRMLDLNIPANDVVRSLVEITSRDNIHTKVFGASYKNITQIDVSAKLGVEHFTFGAELFEKAFSNSSVNSAVNQFSSDFYSVYGVDSINKL